MKTALITTTIGVPRVLELYRAYGPDVDFFVAGDQKSPHIEIVDLLKRIDGEWFYSGVGSDCAGHYKGDSFEVTNRKQWKCSELIGWNCIQRRNIALLEALRAGADIIVTIDDDNMPVGRGYFEDYEYLFRMPRFGLELVARGRWVNHAALLVPSMRHRGIPRTHIGDFTVQHAVNRKVGLATGAILGNPDIDAIERMAITPHVWGTAGLFEEGVFISSDSWTVANTQNTAFLRKFAPAMFVLPGVGRMDDIIASLICQRVMREEGYVVHAGRPFCYQERNAHNLVKDLRAEEAWYDRIDNFALWLDRIDLGHAPVLNMVRLIWGRAQNSGWFSEQTVKAALAFLDDCEEAMK